jgi:hypothetical protein
VVDNVTGRTTKVDAADGKTTENVSKTGPANAIPIIGSHSAALRRPSRLSPLRSLKTRIAGRN